MILLADDGTPLCVCIVGCWYTAFVIGEAGRGLSVMALIQCGG